MRAARPYLIAQTPQHENIRQAPYASPFPIDSIVRSLACEWLDKGTKTQNEKGGKSTNGKGKGKKIKTETKKALSTT